MRLLVTRPLEDAAALAATLRERGHEPILAPLMEIHFREGPPLQLDDYQAVLATSANGMRALAKRSARRDIAIFAVGPQTAQTAQALGFGNVRSAAGDAAILAASVAQWSAPEKGALLHAAGTETAGNLRQTLEASGFRVEAPILYEAVATTTLPIETVIALQNGTLDGVLLYSPRSAKIFATLVHRARLHDNCKPLTAFCISGATAGALMPLECARVRVATEPNQEAVLALLEIGRAHV